MSVPEIGVAREQERLNALARYAILDTPREEAFDSLTRLAQRIFDVPISTVSFIDAHRQWFKSQRGLSACETDRASAFCNITIKQPTMLVIPDATADERFAGNEFVVGEPHIRFYAGMPLRTQDGHAIGSLCAAGSQPRNFSRQDQDTLADLGALAVELLELRRQVAVAKSGGDAPPSPENVLKAGRIAFNNNRTVIRCTVRHLTRHNAIAQVLNVFRPFNCG